jgi:hypothetical protein
LTFAIGGSDGRADVAESVHALDEHEAPVEVVHETHIGRSRWVGGFGGKLEGPSVAGSTAKAHDQLLDGKVAGVGRFLLRVPAQFEGAGDPLPDLQREAPSLAALDQADR